MNGPAAPPDSVDVAIVGAGPAGLTLATLLRRYRPQTRVAVFEKHDLPRHSIGESLLVDVNRVLADMGAVDAVEAAGFSRKYGATFVWGEERRPFSFLWKEGQEVVDRPSGYQLDYTWHVDRWLYDKILCDTARHAGAAVYEGYTAVGAVREGGRVGGVRLRGPGGVRVVRARWVVDCGGRHGPLSRSASGRRLDEQLRNVAVWGYMRGVGFREDLTGTSDRRRTLILTHPRGWLWVIPLRDGVASVGFVTSVESYRAERVTDLRRYYQRALAGVPEHEELFAATELVDYRGDGRLVHAVEEYSYQCDKLWDDGWIACGDASGFVDAILSIGCFVAQTHAQFLACALATVLDGELDPALALDSYATSVRENLASFRAVAHMFYAFNDSMSEWWTECSAQLRASTLVPSASDREAFLAFFTGFSARTVLYDQAVSSLGGSFLLDVGEQLFGAERLFADNVVGQETERAKRIVKADPVLRFAAPWRTRPFALPRTKEGRLRLLTRLDIGAEGSEGAAEAGGHGLEAAGGGIGRRLYLPGELAEIPGLLDGRRSLSDVARALVDRGPPASLIACRREVMKLAYRLLCMGAVAPVDEDGAAEASA